jgi:hypothetical protein
MVRSKRDRIYNRKWKMTFIGIAIVASIMIVSSNGGIAFADPQHCDRSGWPSCYSVGFDNGKANTGTSCPSGHSKNYCRGWEDGSGGGGGGDNSGRDDNVNRGGGQSGYSLTVNVPRHPFGKSSVNVSIKTANGYTDFRSIDTATSGTPSAVFDIPPNQGDSVQVCVDSGIISSLLDRTCQNYSVSGGNMRVSQSAP